VVQLYRQFLMGPIESKNGSPQAEKTICVPASETRTHDHVSYHDP
jgi:hypothetical protein